MPYPAHTRFDLGDTITVYVLAPDGALIDVIHDVDLGDPIEARRERRIPLKEAALWGAVASGHYQRSRAPGSFDVGERGGGTKETGAGRHS